VLIGADGSGTAGNWDETELRLVLESMAGVVDGAEAVDELSHALQCATHALAAAAPPSLVAAALFHDVGRAPGVQRAYPGLPHEEAGARWVAQRFGERVPWLVRAHVPAKIYLVETDEAYFHKLSSESTSSLGRQRGKLGDLGQLVTHPWWPDALQLRRWDDAAKVVGAPTAGLDEVLNYLRGAFS